MYWQQCLPFRMPWNGLFGFLDPVLEAVHAEHRVTVRDRLTTFSNNFDHMMNLFGGQQNPRSFKKSNYEVWIQRIKTWAACTGLICKFESCCTGQRRLTGDEWNPICQYSEQMVSSTSVSVQLRCSSADNTSRTYLEYYHVRKWPIKHQNPSFFPDENSYLWLMVERRETS